MTKRSIASLFVAVAAALSLPVAARAGDVVVPEDAVVAAAAKAERSTVVLRVTRSPQAHGIGIAFLDAAKLDLVRTADTQPADARARRGATPAAPAVPAPVAGKPPATVVDRDANGKTTVRFGEAPTSAQLLGRFGTHGTMQACGVFVGDGHAILTAAVAVDGATKIEVVRDGVAVEAVVAGLDRDFDVAVLRTSASGPALEIDAAAELEPGRVVIVAGGGESGGVDVRFVSSRGGTSPRRAYARLSTSVPAASVGAPALGPDGRLRGLVVGHAGLPAEGSYAGCAACHVGLSPNWLVNWVGRADLARQQTIPLQDDFHGVRAHAQNARGDASPAVAHLAPGRRIARAVRDLLDGGRVKKAYLGIVLDRVDAQGAPDDARRVAHVLAGSPAEGRLLAGDRILAVGARELSASDDAPYEILALEPGRPARLVVERAKDGAAPARVEVEVTPTERREDASTRGPLVFGFDVIALTPELRAWMGREEGEGLVISAVTRGGAAERAGFARGDRVLRLAGRAIASQPELQAAVDDALRGLAAGGAVVLEVERDGKEVSSALHGAPTTPAREGPAREAPPRGTPPK